MKVKLQDILRSAESLKSIAAKEFSAKTSYMLSKIMDACDVDLVKFMEISRKRAVELGGSENDDGIVVFSDDSVRDKFISERKELAETTDVDIDASKIEIRDFGDAKIKPSDLAGLKWMIAE